MNKTNNEVVEMVELTDAEMAQVDGGFSVFGVEVDGITLAATAVAVGVTAATGGVGAGIGVIAAGALYSYFG